MTEQTRRRITVDQADRIEAKLDRVLRILTAGTSTRTEGVQHLADGSLFAPGTGTLRDAHTPRTLSPEAQAALNALDQEPPET